MSKSKRLSWRRCVNRGVAPVSAVIGIFVVFASVMFVEHEVTRLGLIGTGLLVMQAGVWYMANPLLTSERHNTVLRQEVDRFIGLVRQLDRAKVDDTPHEELTQLRASMHESVDRMSELAGTREEVGQAPAQPVPATAAPASRES